MHFFSDNAQEAIAESAFIMQAIMIEAPVSNSVPEGYTTYICYTKVFNLHQQLLNQHYYV
jgi:hypothetical protein